MSFSDRFQKTVLDRCVSPRHLGEPAIYKSSEAGSEEKPITGVPSREALEIIIGGGTNSKSRKATYGVNINALNQSGIFPKEGDFLRMREVDFKIKNIDPDGEGGAVLTLQKQA